MKFITVSELRAKATEIVKQIETTKEEVIVTKNGKPVVLMRLICEKEFQLKQKEVHYGKNERDL